jgi:hypothetical protein
MNLKVEEILMVIVAFLIGWFVSNMISGSSSQPIARIKKNESKHTMATKDPNTISYCKDVIPALCQVTINKRYGDKYDCKGCANSKRDRKGSAPPGVLSHSDWDYYNKLHFDFGEIQCSETQSDEYCENIFENEETCNEQHLRDSGCFNFHQPMMEDTNNDVISCKNCAKTSIKGCKDNEAIMKMCKDNIHKKKKKKNS